MTSLSQGSAPFVFTLKSGTNTQVDFLEFFNFLCEHKRLTHGDYLVMDNCGIHGAEDTSAQFFSLAKAVGVHIKFLPKYSPELNPCELVFGMVKNYLRSNRCSGKWADEILFALRLVTSLEVFLMYLECVWMDFMQ